MLLLLIFALDDAMLCHCFHYDYFDITFLADFLLDF